MTCIGIAHISGYGVSKVRARNWEYRKRVPQVLVYIYLLRTETGDIIQTYEDLQVRTGIFLPADELSDNFSLILRPA